MERAEQVLTRRRTVAAHGLTLLEMVFSMAIFSVVIMTLYGFMMTQAMVSVEEYSELKTQRDTCMGIEQLLEQLESCRLRRIDSMGAWVQYSLPKMDVTAGGFELDKDGSLIFGVNLDGVWYTNAFWSAAFVRSNESDDYLKEQSIRLKMSSGGTPPEGAPNFQNGLDLNGNNTNTDIFIGGHIQLTPYDSAGNPIGTSRRLSGKYFMELDPTKPFKITVLSNLHGRLAADDYDSLDQDQFATFGNGDLTSIATTRLSTMRYKGQGIFLMRRLNGQNAHKADILLGAEGIDCDNFVDTNDNYVKDPTENPINNFSSSLCIRLMTYDIGRNISKSGVMKDSNYGLKVSTTRVKLKNS